LGQKGESDDLFRKMNCWHIRGINPEDCENPMEKGPITSVSGSPQEQRGFITRIYPPIGMKSLI
jgi:hypothetical protein